MNEKFSIPLNVRIRSLEHRVVNYTDNLLKTLFSFHEDDVSIETLTVSLQCPLSKQQIVLPVRSTLCSHLRCFDGYTFLALVYKESSKWWKCPICSVGVTEDSLYVDEKFLSILKEFCQSGDKNGSYVVKFHKDTTFSLESRNYTINTPVNCQTYIVQPSNQLSSMTSSSTFTVKAAPIVKLRRSTCTDIWNCEIKSRERKHIHRHHRKHHEKKSHRKTVESTGTNVSDCMYENRGRQSFNTKRKPSENENNLPKHKLRASKKIRMSLPVESSGALEESNTLTQSEDAIRMSTTNDDPAQCDLLNSNSRVLSNPLQHNQTLAAKLLEKQKNRLSDLLSKQSESSSYPKFEPTKISEKVIDSCKTNTKGLQIKKITIENEQKKPVLQRKESPTTIQNMLLSGTWLFIPNNLNLQKNSRILLPQNSTSLSVQPCVPPVAPGCQNSEVKKGENSKASSSQQQQKVLISLPFMSFKGTIL